MRTHQIRPGMPAARWSPPAAGISPSRYNAQRPTTSGVRPQGASGQRPGHNAVRAHRTGVRSRKYPFPARSFRCYAASAQQVAAQRPGVEGSVTELVAAWDRIWARLPAQASAGASAQVILAALKLLLAATPAWEASVAASGPEEEGRPVEQAMGVAVLLADLCATGLPLDAQVIAAGVLADAYCQGWVQNEEVVARLGSSMEQLLHDIRRLRNAPKRVDLSDDNAASGLRELCLSFYDVRAIVVETASRLELMRRVDTLPKYQQQLHALECLQVWAPMGHAIGLSKLSGKVEDISFKILFPKSYEQTSRWLQNRASDAEALLDSCREKLQSALASNLEFKALAGDILLRGRTKSLFSTMKKLLRMDDPSKGGRDRSEVHDLLGIRAIVIPAEGGGKSANSARADAEEACYIVQKVAHEIWSEVPGRTKDYIAHAKPNGYQSLHTTVMVSKPVDGLEDEEHEQEQEVQTLELQIRTMEMDRAAEQGGASHTAYKGGLDANQARQLKQWTQQLLESSSHATVMDTIDEDGVLSVDWEPRESGAEELFRQLDTDGDGSLSPSEIQDLLDELGVVAPDEGDAHMLFADSSKPATDHITLDDFKRFRRQVAVLRGLPKVDVDCAEELRQKGSWGDATASTSPTGGEGPAMEGGLSKLTPPKRPQAPRSLPHAATSHTLANQAFGGAGRFRVMSVRVSTELDDEFPEYSGDSLSVDDEAEVLLGEEAVANLEESFDLPEEAPRETLDDDLMAAPAPKPMVRNRSSDSGDLADDFPEAPELPSSAMALVPLRDCSVVEEESAPLMSWKDGEDTVKGFMIPNIGPLILGALVSKGCDCVIDIDKVSGRHVRLERVMDKSENAVMVTDLYSTNRTYINGMPLRPHRDTPAQEGDIIAIGGIKFVVQSVPRDNSGSDGTTSAIDIALRCAETLELDDLPQTEDGQEMATVDVKQSAPEAVSTQMLATQKSDQLTALVRELIRQGQAERARHLLAAHVKLQPKDGIAWAQWANLESARAGPGNSGVPRIFYRAAVEALQDRTGEEFQRLGCSPSLVKVLCSWGLFEFKSGQQVSGRRLLRRSIQESRAHPDGIAGGGGTETIHRWAKQERRGGKLWLAKALLKEGLRDDPHNPHLLLLKGIIFENAGKTNAARECFDHGLLWHPRFAGILLTWARMEADLKDMETARGLFRRLLEIDPKNVVALQAWGVAEARSGNPGRARAIFERAVAKFPESVSCWQAWGRSEYSAGNMERARVLYNQALELAPNNRHTLVALANLERNFGDLELAEQLLRRVLDVKPDCSPALQELGYVTIAKGDREGGKALMDQAGELDKLKREQVGAVPYVPVRTIARQRKRRQFWKTKTLENIKNGLSRLG